MKMVYSFDGYNKAEPGRYIPSIGGKMKFEVGKSYYPQDRGFDPVEVIKRTDKSIHVKRWYDGPTWWMRIREDSKGNEMCIDSSSPKKWRCVFTYCADEPVEE